MMTKVIKFFCYILLLQFTFSRFFSLLSDTHLLSARYFLVPFMKPHNTFILIILSLPKLCLLYLEQSLIFVLLMKMYLFRGIFTVIIITKWLIFDLIECIITTVFWYHCLSDWKHWRKYYYFYWMWGAEKLHAMIVA